MLTRKLKKTLFMMCVTALIFAAGSGCNKKKEEAAEAAPAEKVLLPVKGAVAVKRDISRTLNFSGNIDATRRTAIAPASAAIGSRVERIFVKEGDAVREGQILVRMEDFQLQQSQTQLTQLEADYQRMSQLRGKGVTQQQYEQVKTSYDAAKVGHEQLKRSIELRAPFSGTVIGRYLNDGEVYMGAPGHDGAIGILSIAQLGSMTIELMVSEQDFVQLRMGQDAQVKLDVFPDTAFAGRISAISPALNRQSRTANAGIEISNAGNKLRPGMFARVEIATQTLKNVLAVPSSALVVRGNEVFVFTVEEQPAPFVTTPKLVRVKTGMLTLQYAQILEGLEENAAVLTENNASLTEETEIRVTHISNGASN
ncbi:MAG: efflux RND transporter periplasmic adaptor subunit [Chitinispirillia bacterium]|nr:efflux RND transporter periplasmic adaptor subunit [Chitinispirillia bacterium]MCL2267720.1 efflux RND transporter periplasmic adaptor subunit [Chitinispirillia bacterium]